MPAWAAALLGSAARAVWNSCSASGMQALGEVFVAELGVLGGLLGGRQRGHLDGAHLVELEGGLAEGGLGPGAADARGGVEAVGADDRL